MTPIRSVSYGGGVQSTALLVLAARREIDYPLFLFANVGDDSEHPATLEYVRTVAMPYAVEHDIELVELRRHMRDGTEETLMGRIDRRQSSIPIPVRMGAGGAPGNRTCTLDFKIRVINKELNGGARRPPAPPPSRSAFRSTRSAGSSRHAAPRRCSSTRCSTSA